MEVYQRFSDPPLTVCGVCGGSLRKVFHPAGILFKGPGFYATDARSSGSRGGVRGGDRGTSTGEKSGASSSGEGSGSSSGEGSASASSKSKERSA